MCCQAALSLYDYSFRINKDVYSIEVLMKAAYAFIDEYYIHFDAEKDYWIINLSKKSGKINPNISKEFENEVLAQAVRFSVANRTKSIRELLMARALSSVIVDDDDSVERIASDQNNVDYDVDDILEDWFEKNE